MCEGCTERKLMLEHTLFASDLIFNVPNHFPSLDMVLSIKNPTIQPQKKNEVQILGYLTECTGWRSKKGSTEQIGKLANAIHHWLSPISLFVQSNPFCCDILYISKPLKKYCSYFVYNFDSIIFCKSYIFFCNRVRPIFMVSCGIFFTSNQWFDSILSWHDNPLYTTFLPT